MKNLKKFKELFEASIDSDGEIRDFQFNEKTQLDKFIENNKNFFNSNNIEINKNDDLYVLVSENDDLYTIEKDNEGYKVSYSSSEGVYDDYYMPLEDIMDDIVIKMLRGGTSVPYVDLMKYDMRRKDLASENEEDVVEKKNSKTSEKPKTVGLTTPDASKKNNKKYNFDPMPKNKDKNPYYRNVISKKIDIGDNAPVKKFKEWSGKYWRKKGDQYKKYEPNSGVSNEKKD